MRRLAIVAACALVVASCGARSQVQPRAVVVRPHVDTCAAGVRHLGTNAVAPAAVVERPTRAYATPDGKPLARFGLRNINGAPTVFGVLGEQLDRRCRATWLHVELPMRPNGSTGWVRAGDVAVGVVHTRIVVDISARRLRLYRDGHLVLQSKAAVGAAATPVGRFYVNQRLVSEDPAGPYGPGAVGVSAFSNVWTGWAQGGPIGIHGTNEPWSIGHAVSNGCIRLPNPVLRGVFAAALLGTSVLIER